MPFSHVCGGVSLFVCARGLCGNETPHMFSASSTNGVGVLTCKDAAFPLTGSLLDEHGNVEH